MPSGTRPDREVAAARAGGGFTGGRIADSRPDRNRMNLNTVTPRYGWGDAQFSDFGIMGGLSNMMGGILAGNTYAGRTPTGWASSGTRDNQNRAGSYAQMAQQMGGSPTWRSGLYGGAGGVNAPRPAMTQQPRPAAPAQAQAAPQAPFSTIPAAMLNIPGPSNYRIKLPSYGYFGTGQSRPMSSIMNGI